MMMTTRTMYMAVCQFFVCGSAYPDNVHIEVQCLASERVVGIHRDVFRIHRGHRDGVLSVFCFRMEAHSGLDLIC